MMVGGISSASRNQATLDAVVRGALFVILLVVPAWWIDTWKRHPEVGSQASTTVAIALLFAQAALVLVAGVALTERVTAWPMTAAMALSLSFLLPWWSNPSFALYLLASMAPFAFFTKAFCPSTWRGDAAEPGPRRRGRQFTVLALFGAALTTACFLAAVRTHQQLELRAPPLWLPLIFLGLGCKRASSRWSRIGWFSAAILIAPLLGTLAYIWFFWRSGAGIETGLESAIALREPFPFGTIVSHWMFGSDGVHDLWSYGYSAAISTLFAALGYCVLYLNGLRWRGSAAPSVSVLGRMTVGAKAASGLL